MHGEVEVSADARLYFESEGEGHPVVLIHAGIVDSRMWERQFHDLRQRFRVVRYDVRGFGRSSPLRAPYSDSRDLEILLNHLDIDRPMLVGASNGGRIALDYAVEHPNGVEALVPVASSLGGFDPDAVPGAAPVFRELEQKIRRVSELERLGHSEEALDELLRVWGSALPPDARSLVRTMVAENRREAFREEELSVPLDPPTAGQLSELRIPTLVVVGDRDQPALELISDYIAQRIPGAERVEIPGADHLPNLSQPDAFERAVWPFLE